MTEDVLQTYAVSYVIFRSVILFSAFSFHFPSTLVALEEVEISSGFSLSPLAGRGAYDTFQPSFPGNSFINAPLASLKQHGTSSGSGRVALV